MTLVDVAQAHRVPTTPDFLCARINCSKSVISAMCGVAVGAGLVCGIPADISLATRDCRTLDGHTRLDVAAAAQRAVGGVARLFYISGTTPDPIRGRN